MTVPRSMGWAFVIGSVLLALALLSFLALDKPNVVWRGGVPHCPQCRTQVAPQSTRCQACREPFDWVTASEEDSPFCQHCLSAPEDEAFHARRQALGDDKAAELVAETLRLSAAGAREYLLAVGRGQCGWCGGTGRDLAVAERTPCEACAGSGRCAACDGDRRIRLGVEEAGVEIDRYLRLAMSLSAETTPVGAARKLVQEGNTSFLRRFAGTAEVAQLYFAPAFRSSDGTPVLRSPFLVAKARGRLDAVLGRLSNP